jgi:hypothetical protein
MGEPPISQYLGLPKSINFPGYELWIPSFGTLRPAGLSPVSRIFSFKYFEYENPGFV